MITSIIKLLKAYFSEGGIFIEILPNQKLLDERNVEYYDVTCRDEYVTSFDLVSLTEDYRTSAMEYEEVIAEVIWSLIDTIEGKLMLYQSE